MWFRFSKVLMLQLIPQEGRCVIFAVGLVFTQVLFAMAQEGLIAYTDTDPVKDRWDVYVIDAHGGNPRNLTDHPAIDGSPTWSPDGREIAFLRRVNLKVDFENNIFETDMGIYIMTADGGNLRRLTPPDTLATTPCWSPDGEKIAYVTLDTGKITLMNPDGNASIQLTEGTTPRWSPDGRQIVFVRENHDLQVSQIYVMNADGSSVRAIGQKGVEDQHPTWSPDGRRIAFTRRPWPQEIYVMNANGSRIENLTGHPGDDMSPEWSPAGTQIAFSSNRDGNLNLYVMDTDGRNQRRLTDSDHWHWMGQWYDPAFARAVQQSGKSTTTWAQIKAGSTPAR